MKLIQWITGIVIVQISNLDIERFFNLCRNHNLNLYHFQSTDSHNLFHMYLPHYLRIRPVARKLHIFPKVIQRKGLPFLLTSWNRKRLYCLSLFIGLFTVLLASFRIWNIDISGCKYHTKEAILEFLRDNSICSGTRYYFIDYQQIEDMIRLAYDDISWVSVERKGTNLYIKIQETSSYQANTLMHEPSHLIASGDGIIDSIITRTGIPYVKAGDIVKKGDILISGIIPVIGDYGENKGIHLVKADGDVRIIAEKNYYSILDLCTKTIVLSEYKRTSFSLIGFGYQVDFFIPFRTFEDEYVHYTQDMDYYLNHSLKIPITIRRNTYQKSQTLSRKLSNTDAEAIESKKFHNYLAQFEKKGVLILENNVKIEIGENLCVTKGSILVSQKEEKRRRITDNEWRELESYEYHGNDP